MVSTDLTRGYELPPLMASHYEAAAAFRQKVGALAGRRETQARDVFDLHHLRAAGAAVGTAERLDRLLTERAIANALTVDFAMFKSQVLGYLPLEDQASYDSSSVWETIVLEVVEALRTKQL
jgi:hypothetical protein